MLELVIPKGAYHRANGNLPPFDLVNMLAEETPSAQGGVSLLSFPGLEVVSSRGSGPIQGVFRQDDLFSGDQFCVSNGHLFRGASDLGAIDGTGPVWWAASDIELCVGRGTSAYSYNGTNLQAIAFPDSANVVWGTFLAGLFVFARSGSRKFYWSAVLDARTIDALDFASAESSASYLLQVLAIGDILYCGCKDKIEAWYPTGDGVLPFLRISQRTCKKGLPFSGCMAELDNALHFVADDHAVYRMAGVPTRISNHGIEEQIAGSATCSVFAYYWEGHAILNVRLDASTYGFDVLTGQWHERRTTGLTNWIAQCACQQADGSPLFGSATGDDLLEYSGWAEGTSELARVLTGAVALRRSQIIDSIELECNAGQTTILSGAGSDPVIMLEYSNDGGNTWKEAGATGLGNSGTGGTGAYRTRAKWRRLGSFDAPGALFRFTVTDPVPFRVSGSFGDESSAGRARA